MNTKLTIAALKTYRPLVAVLGLLLVPRTGLATTITNLLDNGSGSLRWAIANTAPGGTINFASGLNGTITLTNGELVITNSLTFVGPGATNLFISGNQSNRIFNITSTNATVVISNVTICNGHAALDGGGIYNAGNLNLIGCLVSNNQAGSGIVVTNGGAVPLEERGAPPRSSRG